MREAFKRTGLPAKEFHRITYKAGSWKHKQQVIVKLEIGSDGHKDLNIRFVVHSFNASVSARQIYNGIYSGRGEMELYIKKISKDIFSQTGCHVRNSGLTSSGFFFPQRHILCCWP